MAGYGSYGSYDDDHLNKPLPPTLTASPAPMDADSRQPTLPFRQDTIDSGSHYSQRGNTLPPARQDTYTSSVYSSQPTAYGGAYGASTPAPAAAPSVLSSAPPYSAAPSYTSQQNLGTTQQHSAASVSPSSSVNANPFDTPFDDHAASSRQNLTGMGSHDTEHGIPLQDRGKDPADDLDHVYEAPKKSKKQGVRFGELGMFSSHKNRIPWVVYIFSAIQIGVFIGELIDNCKARPTNTAVDRHRSAY